MVLLKAIKQKGHFGSITNKMPGNHEKAFFPAESFGDCLHGLQSFFIPATGMARWFY
jgi:hypothetical protein